ncbi:LysM peptidoglycan-binding domain-containing protein [Sporolactobacillus kofuensis]|uniref:LysM peptidoglycan-binding domain-containing protein n=1 Tax=Sporolactobacillus kofuensis TaxID=269672 RepID=A0ABW1WC24_9BACL|nr:LysM peptidoglycan-binding domain-containing protein [Sporolactobacillus kofuensis]MCO7175106.1 LysM peptidoglycan-binding domain-containing protein [Sporolactobacillus kofuensis]
MKKIIVPAAIVGGLIFSATGQQALAASGQDVVNKALSYQGKPYVYGAPSFSESMFDCSSFTQLMYSKVMNISLPRTSSAQATIGTRVSKDQVQPGDLLFFDTSGDGKIDHVGIYIGNGQMISSEETVGVHITNVFSGGGSQSYWEPKFINAQRVIASGDSVSAPTQNSLVTQSSQSSSGGGASSNSYTVKSGDSLWAIAHNNGISLSKLKSLNGLKSNLIYPGQVLKLSGTVHATPSSSTTTKTTSDQAAGTSTKSSSSASSSYTVKSGDNLWAIANKNGMSLSALKSMNGLHSDLIYPGQTLKLSVSTGSSKDVTVTQTSYAKTAHSSSTAKKSYKVASGDSLWQIATLHGTTVNKLMRTNNLSSTLIYPGQHLQIPESYL